MKPLSHIKKVLLGIYSSVRRFPATIGFSAATAVMLIIVSELEPDCGSEHS